MKQLSLSDDYKKKTDIFYFFTDFWNLKDYRYTCILSKIIDKLVYYLNQHGSDYEVLCGWEWVSRERGGDRVTQRGGDRETEKEGGDR